MDDIPTFEDEILAWRNTTHFGREYMTDQVKLTFGDGSMLKMEVKVRIPRSPELIPPSEGESESYDLMVQSTAMRLMCKLILSPALGRIPERKKTICPKCRGLRPDSQLVCDLCEGDGTIFIR
jgi:hypothetical protein